MRSIVKVIYEILPELYLDITLLSYILQMGYFLLVDYQVK